jgi:hypothetical protein
MAIPSTGPLTLQAIQTEFGGTNPIGLNEYYAGGGLVPPGTTGTYGAVPTSGTISIRNFYGTSNRVAVVLNISANTLNYDVYTQATANPSYIAGISDVVVNISPAIYVGSASTGSYSMLVPASFSPTDTVRINNSGFIYGAGGNAGAGGGTGAAGGGGNTGGNALFIGRPTSINNLSTIASGGGGGGGGGNNYITTPQPTRTTPGPFNTFYGGGGGGGGMGSNGGAGGAGGVSQGNGSAGGSGTTASAGGGGAGANGNPGGNGGSVGAGGSAGNPGIYGAGAGGGTGSYIVGNPLVTYIATGTLLGNVS